MEKKLSKRKLLRRRYKRYAAAVAGAAIMAGVAVPGVPAIKAEAAERTVGQHPIKIEQAFNKDWDAARLRLNGWHEHKDDWPSADENQGWYKDGKIYYRSDRNDRENYGHVHYLSSPVGVVQQLAPLYGFDRYDDTFLLLSRSGNTATVQVIKHDTGKRFLVGLERVYGGDYDWRIVSIRE